MGENEGQKCPKIPPDRHQHRYDVRHHQNKTLAKGTNWDKKKNEKTHQGLGARTPKMEHVA